MITLSKPSEVFFNVTFETTSQAIEFREFMSFFVKDYKFNPKFRAKQWDGKISFYKAGKFPIGLLKMFEKFCINNGYEYGFDFDKKTLTNEISEYSFKTFLRPFLDTLISKGIKLRDYQEDAFKRLLSAKRGVIELAVNSGKSFVIYLLIRYLLENTDKKILLIVPNITLTNQMFSDFKEYGWKNAEEIISIISSQSETKDLSKRVQISTWQSLMLKDVDKEKDYDKKQELIKINNIRKEFLKEFGSVLVDEVHGSNFKSKLVADILTNLDNAEYRFGCTGTLPEEKLDLLTIFGFLGPRLLQVTTDELIARGISSKVEIVNVLVKYSEETIQKFKKLRSLAHDPEWKKENPKVRIYDLEVEEIIRQPDRNKIFGYILNKLNPDHNIMIICKRIEHLKSIQEYLENTLKRKVFVIYGATKASVREEIRTSIEGYNGVVLLGTYKTIQVGLNIKKLHHLIFASGSKSRIQTIQTFGRGLRKHSSKETIFCWDVVDDLTYTKRTGTIGTNYSYDHWLGRLAIYNKEKFPYKSIKLNINDLK